MMLEARFHEDCFKKILMPDKKGKLVIRNEMYPLIKWFSDSPFAGEVDCLCSICNKPISEEECPLRLWREIN